MSDNDPPADVKPPRTPLPRSRRPRLLAFIAGGAAALIVAGAAGWALRPQAEADPDPFPDQPESVYHAADVRTFDDLGTMTASSALVVHGTAVEARPGDTVALDDGSETTVTGREVVVEVDQVVFDRFGIEAPETVVVAEGFWENGIGYTREGMPWTEVGQSGYFYLAGPPPALREDELYTYIHETGRVLIAPSLEVSIPGHWQEEGPWAAADLADGTSASFTTAIQSAAEAAESGEAIAELVSVCVPTDPADENSAPLCWEE
ncbi:hypothetical protein ACFQS3_01280 [Glycomyces mayteni]|uniref:Alternate signal-mediated exported protein, RER_14450 family n=1 Tax=Glycomyces mayteni TaxID=543887 RepID=A0ABW2D311_9ACTN